MPYLMPTFWKRIMTRVTWPEPKQCGSDQRKPCTHAPTFGRHG
jgi:hypothetical protein